MTLRDPRGLLRSADMTMIESDNSLSVIGELRFSSSYGWTCDAMAGRGGSRVPACASPVSASVAVDARCLAGTGLDTTRSAARTAAQSTPESIPHFHSMVSCPGKWLPSTHQMMHCPEFASPLVAPPLGPYLPATRRGSEIEEQVQTGQQSLMQRR